ncbi:MAG TPA: ATP-dependent sacrificial sulfur transferase LarE [Clostridiales bacterium]|nr:ATP-dependent sacrificial sulfur transferase LarE [Clostridiales bacterium]HRT82139.1 ATP-dependent sacrificial sulfur transferase LarE [Oscillospiraceae bacterium]
MTLSDFFTEYPKVAVAFSGGVDSAYLLFEALKNKADVKAYYVKTAFQPDFETEGALRFASEFGADLKIIEFDILKFENITANQADRCYHCKRMIFEAIMKQAKADDYEFLLDGTNASDLEDDRPGMKALKEMGVLSPLRLCGLSKDNIRLLSKEAGLFTWDRPAYSCLATRIISDEISEEKLSKTEAAESYMFSLGFKDFRVRTLGERALIQILSSQFGLFFENRDKILNELKKYYKTVLLDLEARDEQGN